MEGTYEAPPNTCPYAIDYFKELKMSQAIKQSKKNNFGSDTGRKSNSLEKNERQNILCIPCT